MVDTSISTSPFRKNQNHIRSYEPRKISEARQSQEKKKSRFRQELLGLRFIIRQHEKRKYITSNNDSDFLELEYDQKFLDSSRRKNNISYLFEFCFLHIFIHYSIYFLENSSVYFGKPYFLDRIGIVIFYHFSLWHAIP